MTERTRGMPIGKREALAVSVRATDRPRMIKCAAKRISGQWRDPIRCSRPALHDGPCVAYHRIVFVWGRCAAR